MVNTTLAGRWFRRVLWAAILANLVLAIPAIAAPGAVLAMAGLPTASADPWPRLAALQLVVLSAFYAPAAVDIDRHRTTAWLVVAAHLAGAVFFLFEPGFRVFAFYDFLFAALLAMLLTIAVRREGAASARVATV